MRPSSSPSTTVPFLPGPWIAVAIIGAAIVDGLLLLSARLRIDISWASICLALCGPAVAAIWWGLRVPATERHRIARDLIEGIALFAIISLLGAVASYPLATGGHGFVDATLERIDLTLHFDWLRWYEAVADHRWIQPIERGAYLSIFVTPLLLLGYFAWSGRRAECRLFIATFAVAELITLALFPLLPAIGPLATLWHGAVPYMPVSALYQDQLTLALRHHALHSVDVGALHGLVCAPSFHAASAVLYIATAWRIASLRWSLTALNVAMLLATPVEGTHYLSDVLCGVLVAIVALWLTPLLIEMTASRAFGRGDGHRAVAPVAAE